MTIADIFDFIIIRREGAAFPPRRGGRGIRAAHLMNLDGAA